MSAAHAMFAILVVAALGACAPRSQPPEWRDWEAELYAQGLLRTERAPFDAPYGAAELERNFARIAFGLEPQLNDGRTGRGILRRWEDPVRWRLHATGPRARTAAEDVAATFGRIDLAP